MATASSTASSVITLPGYMDGHISIQEIQTDLKRDAEKLLDVVLQYLEDSRSSIESLDFGSTTDLSLKVDDVGTMYTSGTALPGKFSGDIGLYTVPSTTINNISFSDIADIGPYAGYTYTPSFSTAPDYIEPEDPGPYTGDTSVDLPAKAVLDDVIEPNFIPIHIPDIKALDLPAFTAVVPKSDLIKSPTAKFEFTEVDYTSDVLVQTDGMIQQMIAGGVGIPESIWQAIWERSVEQQEDSGEKLIAEVTDEWGGRGFSMPQGAEDARIAEIRTEVHNKRAELSREMAINYSQEEIKNLQFAVQQGIAFESLRGGWHQEVMKRALEVSQLIFEADYKMFEAEIKLINFQLERYQVQATVYKTQVDAEIAKLEEARLAIQAQDLTVKSNNNLAAIYDSRIKAVQLDIDLYNSHIKSTALKIEAINADVKVYGERIKAYVSKIQAAGTKADIYKTQVEAEGVKVGSYETAVKAYTSEVQGYIGRTDAQTKKIAAQTEIEGLKISKLDSEVKAFTADISARTEVYKTELEAHKDLTNQVDIRIKDQQYAANVDLQSDGNKIKLVGEEARVAVANANLAAKAAEVTAQISIDLNKSAAEIAAGLSGSIYSAIHASSSESDSINHTTSIGTSNTETHTVGESTGVTTSYNYNYTP